MMRMIQRYYDIVRPYLPRRMGTYGTYVARDDRLFDRTTSRPNYKEGLVNAITKFAPGKDVCIVGFGRGISSMVAIDAGAKSVTAYEASSQMIETGKEAFALNGVPIDAVTIVHAIVGEAIEVFGSPSGASRVDPQDFDPTEVLVLDCEGAERSILEGLSMLPEVVIVETHPERDVPTDMVRSILVQLGFSVDTVPYQPGNDLKKVLIGTTR